jgi:hypothetical protein
MIDVDSYLKTMRKKQASLTTFEEMLAKEYPVKKQGVDWRR